MPAPGTLGLANSLIVLSSSTFAEPMRMGSRSHAVALSVKQVTCKATLAVMGQVRRDTTQAILPRFLFREPRLSGLWFIDLGRGCRRKRTYR